MAVSPVLQNITAVQTVAAVGSSSNPVVTPQPVPGLGMGVGVGQALFVTVSSTTAGAISASVQFVGSNDGVNWVTDGSVVTASGTAAGGGNTTFAAGAGVTVPYAYFGAYVTAVSGTGAKVSASINA